MITEDYVSFETAKLLKKKGFVEECRAFYVHSKECGIELFHAKEPYNYNNNVLPCTSAPTTQMVMKWLREVHKIHIEIGYNIGYFPVCISTKTSETIPYKPMQGKDFTYEQACEAAIKYCLENLI